jgi:DNA-binding GntR family transcriptional regulator
MNQYTASEAAAGTDDGSETPRRLPMSERAYHELKHRILTNQFQGGEYVLEEELAKLLGMSRTPLREALVQLQNEGHIQIVPRRGARIVPLGIDDIREIYDLLQTLESHAAELVARRPDNREVAEQLEEAVDGMRSALAHDDLDAWAVENERFHRHLVTASNNRRLIQFCSTLLDQSHRVRVFTLRLRRPPVRSTENHAELVRAIRKGDAETARAIHVRHKDQWLAELTEIVDRVGLRRL